MELRYSNKIKGNKTFLTYEWIFDSGKDSSGEYKWNKKSEPTFTEHDLNGDPLSQYRGEYMNMPIKEYLKISIMEDLEMLQREKTAFDQLYSNKYSELLTELSFLNKKRKWDKQYQ